MTNPTNIDDADGTDVAKNLVITDSAKTFDYAQTGSSTTKDINFSMKFHPKAKGSMGMLMITPIIGAGPKLYA